MATTVTFTDQSQPGPSGPITGWDLDPGDGSSHLTGAGPWTHDYEDGTYTATLVVTGTSPDGTATVSHTVIVGGSPPAPTGSAWNWDATAATVASGSAAKITDFLTYCGGLSYFMAEVGVGTVNSHSSGVYSVNSSGKHGSLDNPVYFPNGVQAGMSNDHHLAIVDNVSGRWHDMELYGVGAVPTKYFTGGKVVDWTNGASMNIDAVQERATVGGSADAAVFPLLQGVITAAEIASGSIDHPLVFSCNKPGPAPNPYPAASWSAGYPANPGHLPLGSWLRIDPGFTLPGGLTPFERMVCVALQNYGMFLRDQGSNLVIHGTDPGGGGSGFAAYRSNGVNLSSGGVLRFSNLMPWTHLQVLNPPSP